ncbi:hypothetical protein ACFT7S_27315 [Streptomyces sp. NPDC057136]|uniref:hypothetical protein n=1 Tax=Streptomyces sp. NPDC057136 TaxID=3346029 RepID=UPI00363A4013
MQTIDATTTRTVVVTGGGITNSESLETYSRDSARTLLATNLVTPTSSPGRRCPVRATRTRPSAGQALVGLGRVGAGSGMLR